MLLKSSDGSELELRILGYEFPDITEDPWEANRLAVSLRVVSPRGSWETSDPCLTTWEGDQIAGWMAAVGGRRGAGVAVGVTQPNLTVRLVAAGRDRARIRVEFELEQRTAWAAGSGPAGLSVELDVAWADLSAAAAELRGELVMHPSRADPPE